MEMRRPRRVSFDPRGGGGAALVFSVLERSILAEKYPGYG